MSGFDQHSQLYTFDQVTSKVAAILPSGTKPGEFNKQQWLDTKFVQQMKNLKCKLDAFHIGGQGRKCGEIDSIGNILDASQLICDDIGNQPCCSDCLRQGDKLNW
ncbi:3-oxoacyl-[acyl-carrier-protein] synthase, mitochondrial-like [Rutidosis leptorrhynchoides]|uniref:3-oxoacyl-[acyl-carrier-protein] synthase, mitochondrial-like n=1 Tax=Rutidosis leptorrhynchoides TaxID=125765 RepID=UPI003A9A3F08